MSPHTVKQFVAAGAYSAKAFLPVVEQLTEILGTRGWSVQFFRTLVKIERGTVKLKIYCHYKGRPRDTLTFVSESGEALRDFKADGDGLGLIQWLDTL
jgi:hypothetical protein